MTNVIELAKQAGIPTYKGMNGAEYLHVEGVEVTDEIEALIKLVRNAALEQAKQLDWTEVMREGQLVTWGDAETLGDRVTEKLESLKEPTP